ncbi:MAG: hypothetical protein B6U65_04030 [Candidatus Wolframiiraptor sp. EX4484-121]|nr:MAG: hypothetical protein B6U65_04030 [Candidatus Wolframiiraptor sp. EX4484-121]
MIEGAVLVARRYERRKGRLEEIMELEKRALERPLKPGIDYCKFCGKPLNGNVFCPWCGRSQT